MTIHDIQVDKQVDERVDRQLNRQINIKKLEREKDDIGNKVDFDILTKRYIL